MAFPQALKRELRDEANFRCCVCQSIGVEIHHIVPQAEGGDDSKANAAPLCPSCHETYGANPSKRKFIRETRDSWLTKCKSSVAGRFVSLDEVSELFDRVATKDDVERLLVESRSFSPGVSAALLQNPFSFTKPPFVHPLIVKELIGWISDKSEPVVAIDLFSANTSNQFVGEFTVYDAGNGASVEWRGDNHEHFSYRQIGVSPSGIHMVSCRDCGGGSGVFCYVGLFRFETDRAWDDVRGVLGTRDRILFATLGSLGLGDRYVGEVAYDGSVLTVRAHRGQTEAAIDRDLTVPIL